VSARRAGRARGAWRAGAVAVAVAVAAAGCSKDPPATSSGNAGPPGAASIDGRALVTNACLSCHTTDMLEQQRLTEAQWSKVVTKMVGWGANLEPAEVAPLASYLAATYGSDAGAYDPAPVNAAEALAAMTPEEDGPLAGGDSGRGRSLYADRCAGCHGMDARGHIGVLLVERPLLYRAADFARVVRRGRGKMPPQALTDAEVADTLAHLRTLRLPLP